MYNKIFCLQEYDGGKLLDLSKNKRLTKMAVACGNKLWSTEKYLGYVNLRVKDILKHY